MSISVEKYKQVKERGQAWKIKADKARKELDTIYELNKNLTKNNQELENENKQLKEDINHLPNDSMINDLRDDIQLLKEKYKTQKKTIRYLKEEKKKLEQTLTLKEVKIQQLEETKKDLKEQCNELKLELREQQRWLRNKTKE